MLKWIFQEPLVQFLILGAVLIAAERLFLDSSTDVDVITLNATTQRRIANDWRQRWGRSPTGAEQAGMVDEYVREEVLYREALRLGLDTHDTIVRRRLAQKMQFLLETGDPSYRPDDATLQAYLQDNPARFSTPATISFRHLFFSGDRRRHASEDADHTLTGLSSMPDEPAPQAGDPFPFGENFEDASRIELSRMFGPDFAHQVLQIPQGKWTGPIGSAFGQHLVFVTQHVPERLLPLDDIRQIVQSAYLANRVERLAEERYQAIRQRFAVVVDWDTDVSGSGR